MGGKLGEADWLVYVLQARQQERSRISRMLHDEIGQMLSAAGLQLDLLRMDCTKFPSVSARITETQKLLEQAVAQVRELSYALDPEVVGRVGLQGALEQLIERWRRSFRGEISLYWEIPAQLPPAAAEALYRVAELALENAVCHSQARRIEVSLRRRRRGVCLEIRDNGAYCGLSADHDRSRGLALRLMRRQAECGGLVLSLAAEADGGTIIKALYPLSSRAAGAGRQENA